MSDNIEHQIRARAYEIWEQNGRLDGLAQEYWCEAERQVLTTVAAPSIQPTEAPTAYKAAKAKRAAPPKKSRAKGASAVTMQ